MLQTLCTLSKLLNGNTDCMEIIMTKKKMIEKNETLFYHMTNGLVKNYLNSYTTFSIILNGKTHYELKREPFVPPENYIEEETIYERFDKLPKDKEIYNGFFSTVTLNNIRNTWNYSVNYELKYDSRFCNKVVIECICLTGFVVVRQYGFDGSVSWCREATLTEKIKAINLIVRVHGILYLDLIKIEYEQHEILYAIILTTDGHVASILGGGG